MDPEVVTRITTAVGLVFAGGVAISPFVSYGVNALKRAVTRSSLRRIVLPLSALTLGWAFTWIIFLIARVEWGPASMALLAGVGFWAAAAADQQNAKAKESDRRDGGRG